MQEKKSLEDLEQIYAKNKNFQYKPDLNYDTLKISKEELRPKFEVTKFDEEKRPHEHIPKTRDQFIEMKSFLPNSTERMISDRYENPLSELKKSTNRWRNLTIWLGAISLLYLVLNLLAMLESLSLQEDSKLPGFRLPYFKFVEDMQDMMLFSEIWSIVLDSWGIITYLFLIILLQRDIKAHKQNDLEEIHDKGKRIVNFFRTEAFIFAVAYAAGTGYTVYQIYSQGVQKQITLLLIFHAVKVMILMTNFIAYMKYKSAKYVYEDLMFEALEASSSDEESSEMDNAYE